MPNKQRMSNLTSRIWLYSLWVVLLLFQGYVTELLGDEAYYWMYSRSLDWGYFDHPPMIAIVIHLGTSILDGELGARLMAILLNLGTLLLLDYLIKPRQFHLFALLVASIGILHFLGFLALPDSPFLFFFTLYLVLYKSFLKKNNLVLSLCLGLAMAGMLLSKYHGFIIIIITILSNPRIVTNYRAWLSILIAALLCLPHLLWQIDHNYPSLQYHFTDRSSQSYSIWFTMEYLITQPFILGPFTGLLAFFAVAKCRTESSFEKTLKYIFWGGYLFFLLMTFKDRAEAHWTVFTIVPAVYFSYRWLVDHPAYRKYFQRASIVAIILIGILRLFVVLDYTDSRYPSVANLNAEFHHRAEIAHLRTMTQDHPVAIYDSYQLASLYNFYGHPSAISYTTYLSRSNQYDLWESKGSLSGKRVVLLPNYNIEDWDEVSPGSNIRYKMMPNFQSYASLLITVDSTDMLIDNNRLTTQVTILSESSQAFNQSRPPHLNALFYVGGNYHSEQLVKKIKPSDLGNSLEVKIDLPTESDHFETRLAISQGWLHSHPPQVSIPISQD